MREQGQRELNRIQGEMKALLPRIGHGTTLTEVFEWIRTAPELHCKNGDELLVAYRASAKQIDPTVGKLFKPLPRMPYGVDGIKAGRGLGAVYRRPKNEDGPGTIVVDLAKPEIRPKNEIMAILLHEGVPGHHLQYALDAERRTQATLQDQAGRTADEVLRFSQSFSSRDMGFIEGWGLYAESLGEELGLYTDPLDKFGELTLQLSRAARVMVDTGIHGSGWQREQAIRYFAELTGKPTSVASDEVETAISNPGAQLAYTIGQLQFQMLRAQATRELGSQFDVREFHNLMLQAGPLPFDILKRDLEGWISKRKSESTRKAINAKLHSDPDLTTARLAVCG
jgi:uncharacterized protein (DUF885 family)